MTCTILVADVDANIRSVLEYRLKREGYAVLLSGNCADALEKTRAQKPDLIVLDLALPEPSGSGLCQQLLSEAAEKGIRVLALTIYGDDAVAETVNGSKVLRVVQKPFSARQLVADIQDLVACRCGGTEQPL
jgi:DNA-binding response OmpR family regulator